MVSRTITGWTTFETRPSMSRVSMSRREQNCWNQFYPGLRISCLPARGVRRSLGAGLLNVLIKIVHNGYGLTWSPSRIHYLILTSSRRYMNKARRMDTCFYIYGCLSCLCQNLFCNFFCASRFHQDWARTISCPMIQSL